MDPRRHLTMGRSSLVGPDKNHNPLLAVPTRWLSIPLLLENGSLTLFNPASSRLTRMVNGHLRPQPWVHHLKRLTYQDDLVTSPDFCWAWLAPDSVLVSRGGHQSKRLITPGVKSTLKVAPSRGLPNLEPSSPTQHTCRLMPVAGEAGDTANVIDGNVRGARSSFGLRHQHLLMLNARNHPGG